MKKFVINIIRSFKSDQKGSLSVEAVFAFPMLFWAATATFTFFDAYKVQNTSYRANYTISDMISRKTDNLDQAYVDGLHKVFRYMTHTGPESSWIRISRVSCYSSCTDEANRDIRFDWSASANGARELDASDLLFYKDQIPLMAKGSQLILVETSREYKPPFSNALVSFPERDLVSHVVTRPRFAGNLCFENDCAIPGGIDEDDGTGGI